MDSFAETLVRPTVFEFDSNGEKSIGACAGNMPKIRHRSHVSRINLTKIKERGDGLLQSSRVSGKNFGLSYTQRVGNSYAVCQVQEIQVKNLPSKNIKIVKRSVRNKYFNEARLKKIGFSFKNSINLAFNSNSTANTTNSSLKDIIQEMWKEPSAVIEKKRQQFSLHAKMRKRPNNDPSPSDRKKEINKTVDMSLNCVCIQTDDQEMFDL